jgi:ATP-binding cassette, subfamily B, bacterial
MNPRNSRFKRIVLNDLRQRKWSIVFAFLSLLGATVMELLSPWPIKLVVDYILLAKPLPQSYLWLQPLFASGTTVALIVISSSIAIIALLSGGFAYLQTYLSAKVGYEMVYTLRRELFSHLQQLSLSITAPVPASCSIKWRPIRI